MCSQIRVYNYVAFLLHGTAPFFTLSESFANFRSVNVPSLSKVRTLNTEVGDDTLSQEMVSTSLSKPCYVSAVSLPCGTVIISSSVCLFYQTRKLSRARMMSYSSL